MIEIRTASGVKIDLENPQPQDIDICDIARGLSHCCRFAGQLPRFYSVAQHSTLVASLVDRPLRLAALLHDGSEAYMGDLSRNLKHSRFLVGYRVLEEKLQGVIQQRFGYLTSREDLEHIKTADNLAAVYERVTLRESHTFRPLEDLSRALESGFVHGELDDFMALVPHLQRRFPILSSLPSHLAEDNFLSAYHEYTEG